MALHQINKVTGGEGRIVAIEQERKGADTGFEIDGGIACQVGQVGIGSRDHRPGVGNKVVFQLTKAS